MATTVSTRQTTATGASNQNAPLTNAQVDQNFIDLNNNKLEVDFSNAGSKTANYFWAAPNGTAGTPTFRAIVAADIPTLNQSTTGSAATLTTARTLTIGSTGKTFNGSTNVSWSLAEIGAPAIAHKYHSFSANQYFFDTYEQGNYFRLFTENSAYSISRFKTVSNVEYWDFNTSTWVAWAAGEPFVKGLLDGQPNTGIDVAHANRKFRFIVNVSSGWPTLVLYYLHTTWSAITYTPITVTLESSTTVGGTYTIRDTAVFDSINTGSTWGMHAKTTSALHTGDTFVRVTIDITDWVDNTTYVSVPLRNFELLSNYSGSALLPFSWNYDQVVAFNAIPTAPTAAVGTNTTALATTAFVNAEIANDAPGKTGTGASGTWGISVTGSAATLTTARTLTIGSTGKTFDGSANVSWTLAEIGAYAATNPSGYTSNTGTVTSVGGTGTVSGLTLTGTVTTSGNLTLGGTLSVTPSNFASQTANTVLAAPNGSAGVPSFRALAAADIPALDASKITSGVLDAARLPSYVDDVLEYANLAAFPVTGETGKIYVALDTNKTYRWGGSAYVYITSGAVDSVAGKTGVVTLVKGDVGLENVDNTADANKSVSSAATLTTARTIGDVSFNGSANIVPERILYKDTRSTDFTPNTYTGISLHLKTNTTDGLSDGGTYHGILNLQHWSDLSGGQSHQLGFTDNNNIYKRQSASATTWGSWVKIYDADDAATANTASKLVLRDASGNFSAGTITATLSGSASTLTTARTLTIGSTGKTFDGSANVSWTLAEIGAYAATNPSGYTTNTGTVTSVGGTGTVSGLTLTGTVTTSGNLTLGGTLSVTPSNFASQTANTVLAAPNGAAGTPTFRALVAADIPTLNQSTTGNAATATTLQTARNINGVSFNGSADIVTPTIYDSGYTRIINPGGGFWSHQTATVTGALAISLPVAATNTMINITIKVYEYAGNEAFELHVGGYPYTGNTWANNPFAYIIGNPSTDRRFNVRLGYTAAGKMVIYIGETNSTWSYPQVFVTEVLCGYSGHSASYLSGWSISAVTAFENVTATIADSDIQVGYGVSSNTANTFVKRDASGNFSAGTITATLSGTATTATNWGTYGAVPAAGTSFGNANTIGRSDANGYTYFNYINSNTGNSENGTVSQVIITNGSDNFYRKASIAHLTSAVQTNASGTWAINVTGNAASATTATNLSGFTNSTSSTPISGADALTNNGIGYVTSISLFGQTDGALYAQAYSTSWVHQIYGDYRTGQLAVRGKNSGTWTGWRTIWDSSNLTNLNQLTNGPGYTTNTGTVTSVGGTGTVSGLTLTGTVTTSGNLTLGGTLSVTPSNFASQTANTFLAAPNGAAGTPTFRGIVAADIPTLNQNTTGSAGSAAKLNSQGDYTNAAPGTTRGPTGVTLYQAYNNGYPTTYGNLLHLYGTGAGQLLVGWSGTDGNHADNYVRSKRDNDTGAWSAWAKIWTDANLTNLNQLTNGPGYITSSGSITGSAATLTTARTLTIGSTGKTFNGSADVSWSLAEIGAAATAQTMYIGTTAVAINRASAAISLTGTSIDGNAATATNLSTNRTNWSTNGTITAVVGHLAWKNYGNGHTIIDASAGTAPDGTAVNNTNPQVNWSATYPTLMGWNGTNTYGVRVDVARYADSAGSAGSVTNGVYTTGDQTIGGIKTFSGNILINNGQSLQSKDSGGTTRSLLLVGSDNFTNIFNAGNTSVRILNQAGTVSLTTISDTSGNFTASGNVTAYSDERLKKDWSELPANFLEQLADVKHGTYTRTDTDQRQIGVSAQSLQTVVPEGVLEGEYLSVAYGNVALAAVVELAREVVALRRELNELRKDKQ